MKEILPPFWGNWCWASNASFPWEWNMKALQNKSFPHFEAVSESPFIFKDVLDTLWWTWSETKDIRVEYKGTWGLTIVFRTSGEPKDTFWGQYFFCSRSQRVAALVWQSETRTKEILIGRRAGLSNANKCYNANCKSWLHAVYECMQTTSALH